MASTNELACVYSALILADDDIPITSDKMQKIMKAAGVNVDPVWINLFSKALGKTDVKELVSKIGSSAGPAAGPAAAVADAPAAVDNKKESKKEEKQEDPESDEDMGFGLFD